MLLWSGYLILRLHRRRHASEAFRYAILISVIIWSLVEVGAFFGLYPEIWQAAAEHPIGMSTMVVLFVTCMVLLLRSGRARPGPRDGAAEPTLSEAVTTVET